MQLAYRHDERLGESYEALDGKKSPKKEGELLQFNTEVHVHGNRLGPVLPRVKICGMLLMKLQQTSTKCSGNILEQKHQLN